MRFPKSVFCILLLICSWANASTETVSACTQTAIETARNTAGVGGSVIFPACNYTVDNLQATLAKQRWVLEPGAMLIRSSTTTGPILNILADLEMEGGVLDGARGVNLTPHVGVVSVGAAFKWQNGILQNVPSWGIAIDDAEMLLRNLKITNTKNAGVIWMNTSAVTRKGPLIENVRVDRSGEDVNTITSGGILIHAAPGKWVMPPRVIDCDVLLPETGAYDPVGIELFNSQHARVIGNKVAGGRIGISFAGGFYGVVMGNVVAYPRDYAIEIGTGSSSMNIQGNNATGYGPSRWGIVASENSTNIRAIGNALAGFSGALQSGMSGNSNVTWYSGSSYSYNYGN